MPAIDYSNAGLIITIISNDGTKSQGKVLLSNLSGKGGKISLADMSGLTLMDRPNAADAIDLSTCGKWAPFGVGASKNPTTKAEAMGPWYSWGETEPQADMNYSTANYLYYLQTIGTDYTLTRSGKTGTVQDIAGSRYDVARVKWGSEWRMVKFEDISSFGSKGATMAWKTNYLDITSLNGLLCTSRNTEETRKLFFPAKSSYEDTKEFETASTSDPTKIDKGGSFWISYSNMDANTKSAYIYRFTSTPWFGNTARSRFEGRGVWAVLAD